MSANQFEPPPGRRRSRAPPLAEAEATVGWDSFFCSIEKLDRAVNDLRRRTPDFSAATPMRAWQRVFLFAGVVCLTTGLILLDDTALFVWVLSLALPFLAIAGVRIVAAWHILSRASDDQDLFACDRRFDGRLPAYSVLIPLYREVAAVPGLMHAMSRLDYPADRLEILFITEANDPATRRALRELGLAPYMRIVTVPSGEPRTKPRALNYALQDARGALVTVYDAEDIPGSDQLRRAAEAFIEGGPRLACVQARLGIYNADQSFLSRQFALEYSALFRGLLPALAYLGLPIPLGGTSNHFRRDLLRKWGGWDPFNVTEDADLGIRLARLGYQVSLIQAETLEEAPAAWRTWSGQRTRWIKGWMQTYLVHMRRPARLWRDLGWWRFFGFQVIIGGMILSILVHPWFYALAALHGLAGGTIKPSSVVLGWICGANLATGYGAAWLLTIATAMRSESPRRLLSAIWLPVYWLAISWAAYGALFELVKRPFHWEKTVHTGAGADLVLRR